MRQYLTSEIKPFKLDNIQRDHIFINEHKVSEKCKKFTTLKKGMSLFAYHLTSTNHQYINMSVNAANSSNYPTDMCSVIGFALYDGADMSAPVIGPYCGGFALDDPFAGVAVQVVTHSPNPTPTQPIFARQNRSKFMR